MWVEFRNWLLKYVVLEIGYGHIEDMSW